MSIRYRFILVVILSNMVIYFYSHEKNIDTKDELELRPNLATLNLPINTLFQWSHKELIKGIQVTINDETGNMVIPRAYLYSKKKLGISIPTIVKIQVAPNELEKVNLNIQNKTPLFAIPANKKITNGKKYEAVEIII